MRFIKQNLPTTSGQACIAMLSGKSIDEVIVDMKTERSCKYYEANIKQMLDALDVYGIKHASRNIQIPRNASVPDICALLYVRMNTGNSHWILQYNKKFYDPEYGVLEGEYPHGTITSYLEIYLGDTLTQEPFVDNMEVSSNSEYADVQTNSDYVETQTGSENVDAQSVAEYVVENTWNMETHSNRENTETQIITDNYEISVIGFDVDNQNVPEQLNYVAQQNDIEQQNYVEPSYNTDFYTQDVCNQEYAEEYAEEYVDEYAADDPISYEVTNTDRYANEYTTEEPLYHEEYPEDSFVLELRLVNADNQTECSRLSVRNSQRMFIDNNVMSLSMAWQHPDVLVPLAIYANGIMVGFAMLAFDENNENEDERFWLVRFMINQNSQGYGYGKAALNEIISYFATHEADSITLSTLASNTVALNLFHEFGFVETNQMNDEEVVLRLEL